MSTKHTGHEDVDLARETIYDSQGQRITEDYIEAAVAEVEADETQLDETRAIFPPRGRPSLSRPGTHSPRVEARVPDALKTGLAQLAHRLGRRESDLVREALEEYLAHH